MEYRVRLTALLPAAAIVALAVIASVVTSTAIASRAYKARAREARRDAQTISVRGSARQSIRSDLAVWTVRLRAAAPELPAAYATLENSEGRLMEFLVAQGFDPAQVAPAAIDTQTHHQVDAHGNATQKVEGYTLVRDFTVTTKDVDRVAAASGRVTELIKDGITVDSLAPEYLYTGLADLRISILGEAAKDARTRADEVAKNAGFRIGEVRDVHTGILQVTRPNSTDVSGGGQYDTGTIDKDASVTVTLTFSIGP